MEYKALQSQLKNSKVREGPLYKRSKFLKEWRERWIVLTMNYLFTFTDKTCKQVTDIIDLKQIKSYKSYVRKDEEMIPAGFKIRSEDNEFYFCGRNANQKWSWLVTLERLMDYKYVGSSSYNNIQFIKTRGFISQSQFETGLKGEKSSQPEKAIEQIKKSAQQAKKQVDNQVQKIMKELQNQKQQLKQKEFEFSQKQKLLKQQEEALKRQQEQKLKQVQKSISQASEQQKKVVHVPEQKVVENREAEKVNPVTTVKSGLPSGTKVSQLKNLFEQKMVESSKQTAPAYKLTFDPANNVKKKSKTDQLCVSRARTVTNLFQEFHQQSPEPQALKYTLDFLVKIASDSKFGYYVPIVTQAKSHKNRQHLAQTFVELITDYKDIQNCDIIAKFIQICVFQAPGFFNHNHISVIQNKLIDFLLAIQDQLKIQIILKNMFIVNKMNKYNKNQIVKAKINRLVKEGKREQTKNWARKLAEQF